MIAGENRFDGRAQFRRVAIARQLRLFFDRAEVIADGDDIPKRRVDGIELGLITLIGKAIRQHAFRNDTGPLDQDIARILQPSGRKTKTADRNERVASPSPNHGYPAMIVLPRPRLMR